MYAVILWNCALHNISISKRKGMHAAKVHKDRGCLINRLDIARVCVKIKVEDENRAARGVPA
jgi:hypothetical protein